MNLCKQCVKRFRCKNAILLVGKTTICAEYVDQDKVIYIDTDSIKYKIDQNKLTIEMEGDK